MDSLSLLEQICKEPKFEHTPIFVFLNEIDVLKEKLQRFPLHHYLHDYKGLLNTTPGSYSGFNCRMIISNTVSGDSEAEALEFLLNKVKERCISHNPDLISLQYICAIDNEEMAKILDNVFKKLLKMLKK